MASKQIINYSVHDLNGQIISESSVNLNIKDKKPKYLLHKAIVMQHNNSRQGTASSKTRSEVKGGGKKPWKQKGTGNARSGSSNSPLWKGGGVLFGPKPRSYSKKMNNKEWRLALNTAIHSNFKNTVVVKEFSEELKSFKTKENIKKLSKIFDITDSSKKNLIIVSELSNNLKLSLRNLSNVTVLHSNALNVKDILVANKILVTDKALKNIQEVYSGNSI